MLPRAVLKYRDRSRKSPRAEVGSSICEFAKVQAALLNVPIMQVDSMYHFQRGVYLNVRVTQPQNPGSWL